MSCGTSDKTLNVKPLPTLSIRCKALELSVSDRESQKKAEKTGPRPSRNRHLLKSRKRSADLEPLWTSSEMRSTHLGRYVLLLTCSWESTRSLRGLENNKLRMYLLTSKVLYHIKLPGAATPLSLLLREHLCQTSATARKRFANLVNISSLPGASNESSWRFLKEGRWGFGLQASPSPRSRLLQLVVIRRGHRHRRS